MLSMRETLGLLVVAVVVAGCGTNTKTTIIKTVVTKTVRSSPGGAAAATSDGATSTSGGGLPGGTGTNTAASTTPLAGLPSPSAGDVIRVYRIPSLSMFPTLKVGTTINVDFNKRTPFVGAIVLFHPPAGADPANPVCGSRDEGEGHAAACDQPTPLESHQTFVKRVVAGPGDKISIVNGKVIRNGTAETGSYIQPCPDFTQCTFRKTITIPAGEYFVMGDNRDQSDDSRFWGPVPGGYILGTVVK